jgi:hypothetical protein
MHYTENNRGLQCEKSKGEIPWLLKKASPALNRMGLNTALIGSGFKKRGVSSGEAFLFQSPVIRKKMTIGQIHQKST